MPKPDSEYTLSNLLHFCTFPLGISVAAKTVSAFLLVGQMLLLAHVIDALALKNDSLNHELAYLFWFATVFILHSLMETIAKITGEYAGIKTVSHLRHTLLHHLRRVGPVGLEDTSHGAVAITFSDSVNALQPFIAYHVPKTVHVIILPLLVLIVVAHMDTWSFLILMATAPLIPVFMILVGHKAQALMKQQWKQMVLLGSSFLDYLQGITTLRLFGRIHESIETLRKNSELHRKITMRIMRTAFLTTASLEFFSTLAIALTAITLGSRLLSATINFQTAFAILLLTPELFAPLRDFSASYHAKQNAQAALEKISHLFKLPELEAPFPSFIHTKKTLTKLVLHQVTVSYPNSRNILQSLSCTLHKGDLNLITGESGCGKTTLARMLMGIISPASGTITAFDAHDTIIKPFQWDIGWVPQEPRFISGTLRENLYLAAPKMTPSLLNETIQVAGAYELINALPLGLDTQVGEEGQCLSSGEIRHLALVRTLLNKPEMLILDEPTANLDPITARMITHLLKRLANQYLILAISHRKDITEMADRIFHLQHGSLISSTARDIAS